MASKQETARLACGYQDDPERSACRNCANFTSEMAYPSWCKTDGERAEFDRMGYAKNEKNMRCAVHGFKVMKMGLCNDWQKRAA